MGKILSLELILYFVIVAAFVVAQSISLVFPLLAIYLLFGVARFYVGDNHRRPLVGILHNALALIVSFFVTLFFAFQFRKAPNFVIYLSSAISFGAVHLWGTKSFFQRLIVWIPVSIVLIVLSVLFLFPPEFGFNEVDLCYFSLLIIGMRGFEGTFNIFVYGKLDGSQERED